MASSLLYAAIAALIVALLLQRPPNWTRSRTGAGNNSAAPDLPIMKISSELVAAFMLLSAKQRDVRPPTVERVSGRMVELRERGYNVSWHAMRRIPGGMYSEDIEAFLGRMASAGWADRGEGGTIVLGTAAFRICRDIIRETFAENWRATAKLAEEFGCEIGFIGKKEAN